MKAYRDVEREDDAAAQLARVRRALYAGTDAGALLVEAGELEQGVVDALQPVRDGWGEVEARLRTLVCAAGRAFVAERRGADAAAAWTDARAAFDAVAERRLPGRLRLRAPEGYLHFALDPAAYAAAARRYVDDVGRARAANAVVVGIRSIGTSLSAAVAAAVGSARTFTLRPRGTSGSRRLEVGGEVAALLRGWLADAPDVLVVDEGPGATGETFQRVAEGLVRIGAPPGRIVLFPSHLGGLSLAPDERRAWFDGMRRYPPPLEDDRVARLARRFGLEAAEELSSGRWRAVVPGAAAEPAHIGFERMKHRATMADGAGVLVRYAGVGWWGEVAEARALSLAAAGQGPAVVGSADGFLVRRWASGPVADRSAPGDPCFLEALAEYLVARAGRFRTGEPADPAPLVEVFLENTREALGEAPAGLAAAVRRFESLPSREAHIPDARLQLREWIRTADGYVKVDALDHGDGLRYPGPADSAWDLAGAAVECALDPSTVAALVERCAAAAHESPRELADAVAAHRPVYAACALGDASLAAWEAGTEEETRRLDAEAARYRALLARELAR